MTTHPQNEFYGDLYSYNFDRRRKLLSKWIFNFLAVLFVVFWIAFIFQNKKASEYLSLAGNYFDTNFGMNQMDNLYRLLGLLGFFVLLLPFYTELVHIPRKYWLYPRRSFTQQAFVPVHSKELIIHPRNKNSNSTPKTHYIKLLHPASGKLVPVDVDGTWYEQLQPGAPVHVYYHPTEQNILYLQKE